MYLAGSVYTQSGIGDQSPLLLRHDPAGRLLWAKRYLEKQAPGPYSRPPGVAQRVAVGPGGNAAIAGLLGGDALQVFGVDASSGKDLWSVVYPGSTHDDLNGVGFDGSGNLLVLARLSSQPEQIPPFVHGLLVRYAPNGAPSWTVIDDSIASAVPGAFAVDASGSSTVTSGWLTIGFDASGQQVWTAEYERGHLGLGTSRALALTSTGDVIVAGDVNGDVHVVSYRP